MKQVFARTKLYLLNSALLFTHEIDSAYWNEWELFGIPSGIQLFLIINLALILVVMHGFECVVRGQAQGRFYSWLIVGAGFFAVIAHSYFLLRGQPQFRLPVSLILLAAIFLVSVVQAVVTARWRPEP